MPVSIPVACLYQSDARTSTHIFVALAKKHQISARRSLRKRMTTDRWYLHASIGSAYELFAHRTKLLSWVALSAKQMLIFPLRDPQVA